MYIYIYIYAHPYKLLTSEALAYWSTEGQIPSLFYFLTISNWSIFVSNSNTTTAIFNLQPMQILLMFRKEQDQDHRFQNIYIQIFQTHLSMTKCLSGYINQVNHLDSSCWKYFSTYLRVSCLGCFRNRLCLVTIFRCIFPNCVYIQKEPPSFLLWSWD